MCQKYFVSPDACTETYEIQTGLDAIRNHSDIYFIVISQLASQQRKPTNGKQDKPALFAASAVVRHASGDLHHRK